MCNEKLMKICQIYFTVQQLRSRKLGNFFNPRNTRRFSVLGNEYRVLVSEYRDTEKWAFRVPFLKNCVASPKFFFDVLSGWGGQVHPQKYQKIVGEASFPFLGPGKNLSLEAKFLFFCPWGACLGPQDMDQKFQKWVSDTSTGQKQHLFIHITSKNHVLVPTDTPQLKLKSGPYLKKPRFIRKFSPNFGPLGNAPKI